MRNVDARLNKLELGAGLNKCGPEIHRMGFVDRDSTRCEPDHWEAQHSGQILKSNEGESLEKFKARVLDIMAIKPSCSILIVDRFNR